MVPNTVRYTLSLVVLPPNYFYYVTNVTNVIYCICTCIMYYDIMYAIIMNM